MLHDAREYLRWFKWLIDVPHVVLVSEAHIKLKPFYLSLLFILLHFTAFSNSVKTICIVIWMQKKNPNTLILITYVGS